MSSRMPLRRLPIGLAKVAVTFAVFALSNAFSRHFEIENGVSILYPATAVSIIACMWAGGWGAAGVFLGTIATPWGPHIDAGQLVISGLLNSMEGLVPYATFRLWPGLTRDLRDMKSLVVFILTGALANSAISAIAGNLLVISHPPGVALVWREVFAWWVADFTSALLIATPSLAFGGTLLAGARPDRPRTITSVMQIVATIVVLGVAASFAIRTALLNQFEHVRLNQQQTWLTAHDRLNRMHANFVRVTFLDAADPAAALKLESASRLNDEYVSQLAPSIAGVSPDLSRRFDAMASQTSGWFGESAARIASGRPLERGDASTQARAILAFSSMLDEANQREWGRFEKTRARIVLVGAIVDGLVFLIVVGAAVIMIYTMARPFAQLRTAIAAMREGNELDPSRIDARYLEFQSIAETLADTSRELRRREAELRLQTEKAVRASRHKSEFLAKMSHELRTPLNSIIGFSDLLVDQEDTITREKRQAFLENVGNSAKHLLSMINDLLDIAKAESGKMKLHVEPLDLRISIANTVATTQALFVRKKQSVDVVTPAEPMAMVGDPGRIEQVLLNLLSNANKFTPEGERISVRGEADDGSWVIEVADHGIGISAEDQRRIFDEFEQLDSGAQATGTGLGLALARRFVEAHGGSIAVESSAGAGAIFRVRLPRAQ